MGKIYLRNKLIAISIILFCMHTGQAAEFASAPLDKKEAAKARLMESFQKKAAAKARLMESFRAKAAAKAVLLATPALGLVEALRNKVRQIADALYIAQTKLIMSEYVTPVSIDHTGYDTGFTPDDEWGPSEAVAPVPVEPAVVAPVVVIPEGYDRLYDNLLAVQDKVARLQEKVAQDAKRIATRKGSNRPAMTPEERKNKEALDVALGQLEVAQEEWNQVMEPDLVAGRDAEAQEVILRGIYDPVERRVERAQASVNKLRVKVDQDAQHMRGRFREGPTDTMYRNAEALGEAERELERAQATRNDLYAQSRANILARARGETESDEMQQLRLAEQQQILRDVEEAQAQRAEADRLAAIAEENEQRRREATHIDAFGDVLVRDYVERPTFTREQAQAALDRAKEDFRMALATVEGDAAIDREVKLMSAEPYDKENTELNQLRQSTRAYGHYFRTPEGRKHIQEKRVAEENLRRAQEDMEALEAYEESIAPVIEEPQGQGFESPFYKRMQSQIGTHTGKHPYFGTPESVQPIRKEPLTEAERREQIEQGVRKKLRFGNSTVVREVKAASPTQGKGLSGGMQEQLGIPSEGQITAYVNQQLEKEGLLGQDARLREKADANARAEVAFLESQQLEQEKQARLAEEARLAQEARQQADRDETARIAVYQKEGEEAAKREQAMIDAQEAAEGDSWYSRAWKSLPSLTWGSGSSVTESSESSSEDSRWNDYLASLPDDVRKEGEEAAAREQALMDAEDDEE